MATERFPTKGDWVSNIVEMLRSLEITYNFNEIKMLSKNFFANLFRKKIYLKSVEYLLSRRKEMKLGKEIQYDNKLVIQDY